MTILNFSTLVRNQIVAIQSSVSGIYNFISGSIIRAIIESNASLTLYLSNLIIELLAITRASTSSATDLDSWMFDYGLTRILATAASGEVVFSRFTPGVIAYIPIGATVENMDGSQVYTVVLDNTRAAYDIISNSYLIQVGVSSLSVPVVASTTGATANVTIGGISVLTQTIVGVDTVSNTAAIEDGVDDEDDAAFRLRFIEYISSLARATIDAISYAVVSTQLGIDHKVVENYTYAGVISIGYFYVVVDDGSGVPSTTLLDKVTTNINKYRPMGSTFMVYAPVVITANVSATVTVSGSGGVAVRALVQEALIDFLNSFKLGDTCPYTMLSQVIYNVSPLITNVTSILLNGGVIDLGASNHQVVKAGTVVIN